MTSGSCESRMLPPEVAGPSFSFDLVQFAGHDGTTLTMPSSCLDITPASPTQWQPLPQSAASPLPLLNNSRNPALDILRVVAIFCVMINHTPPSGDSFFQFVLQYLTSARVPTLFILSGFFAARKIESLDYATSNFFRDKFRTLVKPFLIWNILALIVILGIKACFPSTASLATGHYFGVEFDPWSITRAIFGIGRSPIIYQFWFLRDLFFVSCIAFFLCRAMPQTAVLGWLFLLVPFPMVKCLGLFLIGVFLRRQHPPEDHGDVRKFCVFSIGWLVICILAWNGLVVIPGPSLAVFSAAFLYSLSAILGRSPIGPHLARWGPMTFLAFAIHEPFQSIIFRILEKLAWPGLGMLPYLILVPASVFAASIALYNLLNRRAPRLLQQLTGGR